MISNKKKYNLINSNKILINKILCKIPNQLNNKYFNKH